MPTGFGSDDSRHTDQFVPPGGVRTLARLYASTPLHTSRMAGLVAGGRADGDGDDFVVAALAGPTPYLLEYF
jgi:hypothetical protein